MVKTYTKSGSGKKQCPQCGLYIAIQAKECDCTYKFETIPTKNYSYGAKPPILNNNSFDNIFNQLLLEQQFILAHEFRNKLCQLELDRRETYYNKLRQFSPEYVKLEKEEYKLLEEKEKIEREIKNRRSKERKRSKSTTKEKSNLKNIKQQLGIMRKQKKQIKKDNKLNNTFNKILEQSAKNHNNACKKLRTEYVNKGLCWGTAGAVMKRCNNFSKGTPPKYKSYKHITKETIEIQIQGGTTWEDVINGKCAYIKFEEGRKKYQQNGKVTIYGNISLRVASRDTSGKIKSSGRTPVFIICPIILHRSVVGKIKWVKLTRKKVGTKFEYNVIFTVSSQDFIKENTSSKSVGVDLGFRRFDDRLRVACIQDRGYSLQHEISIPLDIINRYDRADDISSIRGNKFNKIKEELIEWKKLHDMPEWLKDELKNLSYWKSFKGFYCLVELWRDKRFNNDIEIYTLVTEYIKDDKHLYNYQANLRRKANKRIENTYRKEVKDLEKQNIGIVKIEDIKWQTLLRNIDTEKDYGLSPKQKRNAKIARPYFFTQCLEQSNMVIKRIDPKNTTKECSHCHYINEVDKDTITLECGGCKRKLDRDMDAAATIDARG